MAQQQYYTFIQRERFDKDTTTAGTTNWWYEIHTGTDREAVKKGESLNRSTNLDYVNADTLAERLLEFMVEVSLYDLTYVMPYKANQPMTPE